jgi:hypothetical protein
MKERTMQALSKIVREFIGLFIDDGRLAITVLGWIAICGLLLPTLRSRSPLQGAILFIGLALILVESVLRGSKARVNSG